MRPKTNECQLEREYLEMLNQMMELSDVSQLHMLDYQRAALHREIMKRRHYVYQENNGEFYRRSKYLMSNLDVLIGFNPPQAVEKKAAELHTLLNSEEFQAFLEGKSDTIKTQYGQVNAH